jgi:hypothetical protein
LTIDGTGDEAQSCGSDAWNPPLSLACIGTGYSEADIARRVRGTLLLVEELGETYLALG